MGTPSSQVLASWVKEEIDSDEWVSLRIALSSAIFKRWTGRSIEESEEISEDSLHYVANHLRDEMAQSHSDGAICPFEIDNEDPPYVRATGKGYSSVLEKLKKIPPFEFESVCAKLLEKLGGNSTVTAKTGDGGIDFISVGVDILPSAINSPMHCRAAVIGQAKRYTTKLIAEKALREFVGSSLIERNSLRIRKQISPLTPVLLAFWTTANFEPNCKEFARRSGVWLMDGHTIATYLKRLDLEDWIMGLDDQHKPERNATLLDPSIAIEVSAY